MESVKKDFIRRIMSTFKNRIMGGNKFFNIDETAVYFDCKLKRMIHMKGKKLSLFLLADYLRHAVLYASP